jgi:hypothetical protein
MEIGGFSRLIAFVTDALCAGQPFEATPNSSVGTQMRVAPKPQ